MKQPNDLSSEASKLLELAGDVPALDSERRERMKRAVLANAPPAPSTPGGDTIGSPVAGRVVSTLRFATLSAVVISAFVVTVALPWSRSSSGDLAPPTTSAPGVAPRATAPTPSASAGELSSPIANAPVAAPDIPTISTPHALASAAEAKADGRRPTESGAVTPRPTAPSEPMRRAVGSAPTVDENLVASGAAPSASATSPSAEHHSPPVASEATSSLQEEVRLVRSADAAVSAGDPNRALSLLAEHEQRFPRGTLASERAMLGVLALCAAGRSAEATVQAERFKERYPHSPLQERLQHSCAGGTRP
ncbi:hypothetical protein AKJ09_06975 [Labilithrix luteola]|uniref:Outer membrane lipoprotein BamD-like domain-containing protein n=1 Tax=Labilithrix luteola TaxID=1391654 RepID=A0A0K1Q3V0_9BACT|nr:hypothetical protein [Labilithrix luteola]AKV00312.1 hypothetical protein AKJ09_06975 [Labilithrix luteola]